MPNFRASGKYLYHNVNEILSAAIEYSLIINSI